MKCHKSTILPIPKGISLSDACTIPETFFTVWTNLFDLAKLKKDETLLIHGGASGIGLTAVSMAMAFGVKCIVTVGSDIKEKYLNSLNIDRVINYKTDDFEKIILKEYKGVDVILDMVGGNYFQKNLNIMNRFGRLINIAYLQGSKIEANLLPIMLKRLMIRLRSLGSLLRLIVGIKKVYVKYSPIVLIKSRYQHSFVKVSLSPQKPTSSMWVYALNFKMFGKQWSILIWIK